MSHYYYLMNGKNGKGNALNLLADGELRRNFIDISSVDLITSTILGSNASEILKEYNNKSDLSGFFYNASYPHSKTNTKAYAAIFNFENDIVDYYLDKLRYFAEEREYNKLHKNKLKLQQNKNFEEYIRKLLYNILNENNSKLTDYESLISAKMKELIKDKYYNYSDMGINNYINSRIYLFKNILSNYTELRNITLEYMLYIQGFNTNIRSKINRCKYWDNDGMEQMEPIKYVKGQDIILPSSYRQMELADYIEGIPRVKKLNKK